MVKLQTSASQAKKWVLLAGGAAYAIFMLAISGGALERLYSPSPYHRLQAAAFLQGHLEIAGSSSAVQQNLTLRDGNVQQVWGLGAGLWLLPFEALWRLLGREHFPDRVALGMAFFLFACYTGSTGVRLGCLYRNAALGVGLICLTLFCPALLVLSRSRLLIYEETVLYACILSLAIGLSLVRIACFQSERDYWLCAVLAAFAGFVRPTHAAYGLSAVAVAGLILYARGLPARRVWLGQAVVLSGLLMLAGTNWLRFGSPLEFGHRLTATGMPMVYLTRFGNPFDAAPAPQACLELFGALFLAGVPAQSGSGEETAMGSMAIPGSHSTVAPGQAPYPRWRELYLRTFDLSFLALLLAGIALSGFNLFKVKPGAGALRHWLAHQEGGLCFGLLFWSATTTLGLAGFYLHFPILSARYLLDFAPAFWGVLVFLWLAVSRQFPRSSIVLLAAWLGWQIAASRPRTTSVDLLSRPTIAKALPRANGEPANQGPGP